jgi:hypothetical protein
LPAPLKLPSFCFFVFFLYLVLLWPLETPPPFPKVHIRIFWALSYYYLLTSLWERQKALVP